MIAYRGPVLCPTPAEAARILELLDRTLSDDPSDRVLRAKCEATISADPRWRTPLKNT